MQNSFDKNIYVFNIKNSSGSNYNLNACGESTYLCPGTHQLETIYSPLEGTPSLATSANSTPLGNVLLTPAPSNISSSIQRSDDFVINENLLQNVSFDGHLFSDLGSNSYGCGLAASDYQAFPCVFNERQPEFLQLDQFFQISESASSNQCEGEFPVWDNLAASLSAALPGDNNQIDEVLLYASPQHYNCEYTLPNSTYELPQQFYSNCNTENMTVLPNEQDISLMTDIHLYDYNIMPVTVYTNQPQDLMNEKLDDTVVTLDTPAKDILPPCPLTPTVVSATTKKEKKQRLSKQVKCPLCPKYITQKNLAAHKVAVHTKNRERFPCPYPNCTKSYSRKNDLEDRHINPFHRGFKHPCNICQRSFNRKDKLTKHIHESH